MILALDTSLHDLSIGLFSNDAEPLTSFHHVPEMNERGVHDSMLAAKTSELLAQIGATSKQIERIVLVAGPGSFTGLRIGLSFAKGIAYGTGAGLIPISSHKALLASLDSDHQAKGGQLLAYPGYDRHSLYVAHAAAIDDIALVPLRELLPDLLVAGPQSALDLLDGKHEQTILCNIDLARIVEKSLVLPEIKGFESISALEPLYITPFMPHPASMKA